MRFQDANNEILAKYNPNNTTQQNLTLTLEDNQEIVGVYGVYGSSVASRFRSFGFIVKQKIKSIY